MPLIISNQCPYYLLLVVTMGGGPGNKQYLKLIGILNCHLLYNLCKIACRDLYYMYM